MIHPQKDFYTATPINKSVTEEEFIDFINNYPRKLQRDVFGAYEPPLISYNDFELANRWPYSVVAFTYYYSDNPKDPFYTPKANRTYNIVTNYEELFNSKTGFKA